MGLQRIHRAATIAGAGLVALFAILDLGLTWPAISALLSLSEQYGAASATTDRGALLAAATYGTTALSTGLFASYAILVPALGVGLLGWVMLRSPFGPLSGMVAIAAGGLGVVAVVGPLVAPDLGSAVIASSALTTIWVILAGIRLLRMADARGPRRVPASAVR
ncbi:MAG: hypothetical protein FIA92_15785 [Chloroflexi bacterium]|nr:hypothetical protein [Chloroflexota bacterium]